MTRVSSVVGLVAALALASCGGGSSVDIASFFPADNEVSGWTRDPAGSAPQVATGDAQAQTLVDGDADPFSTAPSPFTVFAWQKYASSDEKLDFRIWEVADAAGCASLFSYLASDVPTYSSKTWSTESIGDQGRSAQTASFSWLNACKGKYFLEARVQLAAGGAPDDTTLGNGRAFMTAVAAKVK